MNYKLLILNLIALLATSFPSIANDNSDPWPDAYSRRNFKLGMTLPAFKSIKHPDQKEWPNAFPRCSNDTEATSGSPYESIDPRGNVWLEEQKIIKCEFFYTYKSDVSSNLGTYAAGLVLGDINSSTTFFFVRIPPANEPVLYKITSGGPSGEFDAIAEMYQETLGTSNKTHTESVQNSLGASFDNKIITYKNNSSMIILEKYSETLHKFSVTYILNDGQKIINQIEKERRQSLRKKL